MKPVLEACYFGGRDPIFPRLASAFVRSAERQCATWDRRVQLIDAPPRPGTRRLQHHQNTVKLAHWRRVVQQAPDGTCLLLADADLLILLPIDDIWERSFDLAYTVKRHVFPFNLGVIFLRVSDRTRAAMETWWRANLELLESADDTSPGGWRQRFGGVNQGAFGLSLEAGRFDHLQLLELPCREWNCEESAWSRFDLGRTRILHIKGALRRAILGHESETLDLSAAVSCWRSLEQPGLRTAGTA